MKKHALLIFIFTLQVFSLQAGSFKHLSVMEGLSSRQVFQINKDANGFIWIFTDLGADRYDGNEIRHYELDETFEARSHILSYTVMICDKEGNLWISLKNGKVYAYNKQTDSFDLRIDLAKQLPSSTYIILNDILFDHNNRLYLCLSTGIYLANQETGEILLAGLPDEYVYRIIQVDEQTFYAGTNTSVYQLQPNTNSTSLVAKAIKLPQEIRTESLFLQDNKLYIGSFSNGVFVFDLPTETVTSLHKQIPNVPIRTFAKTDKNTILIATDGAGVYQINAETNEVTGRYITDEDDNKNISGNTISDLYIDERNGIWISTYTNGISYLNPGSPDVQWIKHGHNNNNSLISSHINTIMQDSDGDFWYGTNNGISLYQHKNNKWTHFLNDRQDIGYSTVVLAICEDGKGDIWIGGYGIGVHKINKRTGRVQKINTRSSAGKGVSTDYVFSIYAENNNVWLGGIEGELTCYNIQTDTYTYFPVDCVGDIKPGNNNTLLIAGCAGLAIFDKLSGTTEWHHNFGDTPLRYPIRCLIQSTSGDAWLATNGDGLIRFDPVTKQSHIYTTENCGITSNAINSLVEDSFGRIWFNTEKELYCFDVANNKIISMNEFLDISWGFYNPNASIKSHNGNLAFGTAEGALTFSPDFNFEEEGQVNLIFTDFKLLYQTVKVGGKGSLLEQAINETSTVKLKYAQHSFSIAFSAINFVNPHKIKYEYKLEDFNDQWEESNHIQSVDYMNLSPGTYTFRLKASDKYTQKEIEERSFKIIIGKPFWASGWAIIIYLITITLLIFMFIQFARHKIIEYNAKEKIRSFINIAHDIRTPITLIKAPLSELENREDIPEESKKSLSIASKNAEKLFGMVTQLLDLQKAEIHPEKLKVTQQDLSAYMETKVSEFRLAAIQKGINLQVNIPLHFPIVYFDTNKMNNIMDNLLSNAIKYTQEGSITVTASYTRSKWMIQIEDTGIGIPEKEQRNLFHQFYRAGNAINSDESGSGIGLFLIRKMIHLHHGKISFTSVENQGTTFTVTFPRKLKSVKITQPDKDKEELVPVIELPQTAKSTFTSTHKNILLLAEDNDDMREYLTDRLSEEYEVISVTDGGKALETARELNPDIIISDIIMPVLQGDELCRILKSSVETSHIPVILLTALNERENVILGLEAGANDYIIKPFDFSMLKLRIRNILQSRQHLRETVLSSDINLTEIDYSSQLDKEFLDKAIDIINTELSNPEFAITDFCSMLCMSRTSVYNKIKTLTGQSPNDFIRIIRMNKSKELILSRKHTIGEVSSMVGFSDPKYFSTCFKKQFGISPSKI